MGFLWHFPPLLERKQPLAPPLPPHGMLLGDLWRGGLQCNLLFGSLKSIVCSLPTPMTGETVVPRWEEKAGQPAGPRRVNFPDPKPQGPKSYPSASASLLLPHRSRSPLSTQQASPQSRTAQRHHVLGRKRVVNKLCFPSGGRRGRGL